MNERIRQLALEADLTLDDLPDNILLPLEKFAELIVRECAEVADTAEPFLASDLIKEHFGVKE